MTGRGRRAVTLVELIVALGVTAALAAALLGIAVQVLGLWERTGGGLLLDNEAARLLDRLADDTLASIDRSDGRPGWWTEQDGENWLGWGAFVVEVGRGVILGDRAVLPREIRYSLLYSDGVGQIYRWVCDVGAALQENYAFSASDERAGESEWLLAGGILGWRCTAFDGAGNAVDWDGEVAEFSPALLRWEVELITPDGARRLSAVRRGESQESEAQIRAQTSGTFSRWVAYGGRGQ